MKNDLIAKKQMEGLIMDNVLKTKAVSELLDVNPTTVQRWVKYFNIPCKTNDKGHYLFESNHIDLLKEVKSQLNSGLQMREIIIDTLDKSNKKEEPIAVAIYERQSDEMIGKIEELESKISGKADEVVSYQVLQHRAEIDQMMQTIKEMKERIHFLEEKLADNPNNVVELPTETKKSKKNWLVSMFSL
ncbi:chromosome-anchoring protein RacA [Anaerobacillus sp. MEB173]|uniref:chromosome-anchoring protein RacA n=1 Tax=Anaerobacillus sp. MEB173 TaxID=3383345 RepID=UPI003F8EC2F3